MTRWTITLFSTAFLLLGLQSIGQPKRDKDTTAFQKFDSVEHYKIVQRTSIINAIDYRSHLLLSEIYFYKPDNKTVKFKYFFGGISFTGATNYKRQELIDYCELIKRIRDTTIINSKGQMAISARVIKYGKTYIIMDGYECIYKDDTLIQINYYKNGKYVGNKQVKDKIFQADSSQKQTASQPQTVVQTKDSLDKFFEDSVIDYITQIVHSPRNGGSTSTNYFINGIKVTKDKFQNNIDSLKKVTASNYFRFSTFNVSISYGRYETIYGYKKDSKLFTGKIYAYSEDGIATKWLIYRKGIYIGDTSLDNNKEK
ncbi:MAG: hypothetical protein HY063_06320 [Bacteroidetes bacterium]|nr:hypothetical protein [Bacteroidota bacterium]